MYYKYEDGQVDEKRIHLCVNWLISVKQVLNCCASSFLYVLHGNEYSNTYIQKQFFSIDQVGFDMWDGLWLISPYNVYSKLYTAEKEDTHLCNHFLNDLLLAKRNLTKSFVRIQMFGQE